MNRKTYHILKCIHEANAIYAVDLFQNHFNEKPFNSLIGTLSRMKRNLLIRTNPLGQWEATRIGIDAISLYENKPHEQQKDTN